MNLFFICTSKLYLITIFEAVEIVYQGWMKSKAIFAMY
jgi:hypothetical protein